MIRKSIITAAVLCLVLASVTAFAGNEKQKKYRYQANACLDISKGVPFELTGTVAGIGNKSGLVLQVSEGVQEIVYGIGPKHYWEAEEVDRVEVGDVVTVNGYTFPFSDAERNIAFSISVLVDAATTTYDTIDLRDPSTGCALWRGGETE
jgi:hypothetical protein